MKIVNNSLMLQEINRVNSSKSEKPNVNLTSTASGLGFDSILNNTIEDSLKLQFSKHANMRLSSREINLSESQMRRVEEGVVKAKTKGINESLVIVDDVALVINVQKKVVVTALNKGQQQDKIFTNIDGAVIV